MMMPASMATNCDAQSTTSQNECMCQRREKSDQTIFLVWDRRSQKCLGRLTKRPMAYDLRKYQARGLMMNITLIKGKFFIVGAAFLIAASGCANRSRSDRAVAVRSGESIAVADTDSRNIKEAERVLQARGYKPGTVDGAIDNQTQQASRDVQRTHDLATTGVIDGPTADRLAQNGARFDGSARWMLRSYDDVRCCGR